VQITSSQKLFCSKMIFASLLTTALLAFASADDTSRTFYESQRRNLRGASFCYEDFDQSGDGCWENRPTNLPDCTLEHAVNTPNELCFWTDVDDGNGDVESGDFKDPNFTIGQCGSATYYIREGDDFLTESIVCERFDIFDQWNELGKIGTAETTCEDHWWAAACCFSKRGFSFRDGICSEKDKYLGDECGDEWGICKNDKTNAAEVGHQLSCYQKEGTSEPKCYPSSNEMQQQECTCSFVNFVFCPSKDCNGHACVLTTADLNHYCDWGTGNNW